MIKFEIKADFKKLNDFISDIAKKQMPYATAKTLTDLAGQIQKEAKKEAGRVFTLRNNYVAGSFRRDMARKSDWPNSKATVGSVAPFMGLQTTGGMKSAQGGSPLGAPIGPDGMLTSARGGLGNMIRRPQWVTNLLGRSGYARIKTKNSGLELLVQHKKIGKRRSRHTAHSRKRKHRIHSGKRGWEQKTIYALKKDVKIKPRFDFEKLVVKTVEDNLDEVFRRNMQEAMNGAMK